jgi:hypothetical protein
MDPHLAAVLFGISQAIDKPDAGAYGCWRGSGVSGRSIVLSEASAGRKCRGQVAQ